MKALIRKMPRPEPRRIFSGARGSGILSGSRPWALVGDPNNQRVRRRLKRRFDDLIRIVRITMKHRVHRRLAHSHRDMRNRIFVKSGPLCTCSAVNSILLTLSRDEGRVKLIRLELESAKNILIFPGIRSSTPNYGIDGSVLVDFSNVKIEPYLSGTALSKSGPVTIPAHRIPFCQRVGLTCG